MKEQISDYAWLEKTQRSWHLWLGNPFCISREVIPIKNATREKLIKFAKTANRKEKKRFTKKFPEIKWESFPTLKEELQAKIQEL